MKAGAIVRDAKPEAGEEGWRFVVIEDRGDRVLIRSLDFVGVRFVPCEVVAVADVVEEGR